MKWSDDAERMLSRVPFFVRRRVRERVEEEASRVEAGEITPEIMDRCRKRYLNHMEEEVRGFRLEACFGRSGCPNRVIASEELSDSLEKLLSARDLKGFLESRVQGKLKLHHEFRLSISDCPNGCSSPQITDVGIIGACIPAVVEKTCSACGACVEACRENAVFLRDGSPVIDRSRCLACGHCIKECPTGTLTADQRGYRIMMGGKLGRHPRLAEELPGVHDSTAAIHIVKRCLDIFQKHCTKGQRFGEILERLGPDREFPDGTA